MKKMLLIVLLLGASGGGYWWYTSHHAAGFHNGGGTGHAASTHYLHLPQTGIECIMEAQSQKILEGTDGSVVLHVGEITRRKVDISLRRDEKILEERILEEGDQIQFDYEGHAYTLELRRIRKPLIGIGKAELKIHSTTAS